MVTVFLSPAESIYLAATNLSRHFALKTVPKEPLPTIYSNKQRNWLNQAQCLQNFFIKNLRFLPLFDGFHYDLSPPQSVEIPWKTKNMYG